MSRRVAAPGAPDRLRVSLPGAGDAPTAFREALALHAAGRMPDAIAALQALATRAPRFAPARNALGALLLEAGQATDALAVLEPLAREAPTVAATQVNLGNALVALRRFEEAEAAFRRALAREPHVAGNHYALGRVQQLSGDPGAALAPYRDAPGRGAAHVESSANPAAAHHFIDRYADGTDAAQQAIARNPSHAGAHFNLGVALLAQGQWAAGWRAFEWRTRTALLGGRTSPSEAPVWQGQVRAGATVLVYAEQGFGDTVQFVRHLRRVRERGLRVVLVCQRPLVRLLHANRVADAVLPIGATLPAHDWQVSLSSLAHVLRLHDDAAVVVDDAPYLRALATVGATRAAAPAAQAERSEANRPRRIGIVWAGHPTHVNDRHRSIGLAPFLPLLTDPSCTWVSLQVGPRAAEIQQLPAGITLEDGTRGGRDFADTAATLATLDAVVSVDSAVAHLAGAMGVPTWVLLPRIGLDWRWTVGGLPVDGARSPWYADLRMLRQPAPHDWGAVMESLRVALAIDAPSSDVRR